LPEDEYSRLLGVESRVFGAWVVAFVERGDDFLKLPDGVGRLAESAHSLETFLDDHGARQNRTFVTFGELVASIRGLASVQSRLLQLSTRLSRYATADGVGELPDLLDAGVLTLRECLSALCSRLLEESRNLGMEEWEPAEAASSDPPVRPRQLSRNLGVDETVDERQHIVEIGGRFALVIEASRSLNLAVLREPDELAEYVAQHASEDRCRWYESAVHNIQSMYDTYVSGTAIEEAHPWLVTLRGHASIAFHLLEMSTALVHFYERHENDLRHEAAREIISTLVPKQAILSLAVNTCLRQAYLFVDSCSDQVQLLLETFVSQREDEFVLPDGVTLHARPLALIVQIARHYGTPMEIGMEGESCSAASLMGLIMLAGRFPDVRRLTARGDARALEDLGALFRAGLGEAGQPLPSELGYLKLGG